MAISPSAPQFRAGKSRPPQGLRTTHEHPQTAAPALPQPRENHTLHAGRAQSHLRSSRGTTSACIVCIPLRLRTSPSMATGRDTRDLLLIRITPGDAFVTFRTTFAATLFAVGTGARHRCHATTTRYLTERTWQCGRSNSTSVDHWGRAQTRLIHFVHVGTVGSDIAPYA